MRPARRRPDGKIKPPFSPPNCPYRARGPDGSLPENSIEFGKLDGQPIYLGRTYDDECWLVGTVVPSKGLCYYLDKKGELKSSESYEVVTTGGRNPLEFQPPDFESRLLFVAAGDQDHRLYAAQIVDGENTYIGWVDKRDGIAHLPRDPSLGPNRVKENYKVLIHTSLHLLCICPGRRPPYSYD